MRKSLDLRKNKRGAAFTIILFFIVLFTIMIVGFIVTVTSGILGWGSAEITPIMEDLGVLPGTSTNMSEYAGFTFTQLDKVAQALPWLMGFTYVGALMFTIIFVISLDSNPHPVFIGFYFMCIILLLFGSIIMSNIYQDIYEGTDVIATRLQMNPLMSYMMLYSPFIMTLMAVIAGIFLFSKPPTGGGGFGV